MKWEDNGISVVATLGPATSDAHSIERLLQLGATVFRLPLSKEPVNQINEKARLIAMVCEASGSEAEVWCDIPGEKARFTNDHQIDLSKVSEIKMSSDALSNYSNLEIGSIGVEPFPPAEGIRPADVLVTGDGEQALEVLDIDEFRILAKPLTSGMLGKRRGITVLSRNNQRSSLTATDFNNIAALDLSKFSGLIVSFVEGVEAINAIRAIINERNESSKISLIAKIETEKGVKSAAAIAEVSDAIMLGRGDLLLDVGPLNFAKCCISLEKVSFDTRTPLIVATQLLHSMTTNWFAGRSDLMELHRLCHLPSVRGLMLSYETAASRRPFEIVEFLSSFIKHAGTNRP